MVKFVRKIKSLLGFQPNSKISKSEARQIQKETHKHKHEPQKCTPPYKEILLQLDDVNEQIFQAAVYNLAKIAVNCPKYRDDILRELEKRKSRGYAAEKITQIKNATH